MEFVLVELICYSLQNEKYKPTVCCGGRLKSRVKFIYSEKATKFCEISTLLVSFVVPVKSKVDILQTFVAF